MNFSLERSWEAILLIRSSPVAIIFLNIGFSRSIIAAQSHALPRHVKLVESRAP